MMNTKATYSPERLLTVEQTAAHLNALIEACLESHHWFKKTADGVEDAKLKAMFIQYAAQRTRFIRELQGEVRRLGYNPDQMGGLGDAWHRSWVNIKSAFADGNEVAILAECEQCEEAAVHAYKKGFDAKMADPIHAIVFEQYMDVYEFYSEMHTYTSAIKERTLEPFSDKAMRLITPIIIFFTALPPQFKHLRQMISNGKF